MLRMNFIFIFISSSAKKIGKTKKTHTKNNGLIMTHASANCFPNACLKTELRQNDEKRNTLPAIAFVCCFAFIMSYFNPIMVYV